MKAWLLRLHRWVAIVFALPLIVVLGTGLVLSLEPWLVVRSIKPGTLTPAGIEQLLSQHDPAGKARALAYRSYDNTLTIGGGRGAKGTVVDAATGQVQPGPSAWASTLLTTRRTHETLLYDLGWLVVASSVTMLVLTVLGVLMGLPRIANTLSGWHKGMAWGLLPLIVLSPATGLLMAARISFTDAPAASAARGAPMSLIEAVRVMGRDHDLSALIWMRPMAGGQMVARLAEGGEYAVYAVTRDGASAMPRNWPRLWHEGNFAGAWSAGINLVVSLAMLGLLVTGLWIWLRRTFRRRRRRQTGVGPAAAV